MATKVKKMEVGGISLALRMDVADDFELTEAIAVSSDPDAAANEKMAALVRAYRIVLGDDYRRVKDELRAKHGGSLTNETMSAFIAEVLSKAGEAKNS